MAAEKRLIDNVREEIEEVRERAGEVLHSIWPFRSKEQQQAQARGQGAQVPFPIDIYETSEAFVLLGELPGVEKGDLDIQITDAELIVEGRLQVDLERDERVLHGEIAGADFKRTLTLSDAVDTSQVQAELKDGVLQIQLAKSDKIKPRQIKISD